MNVLIAGHSFVKRYRDHLCNYWRIPRWAHQRQDFDFGPELGLPERVCIFGQSGLKATDSDLDLITENVNALRPEILLLELGTNDLVSSFGYINDKAIAELVSDAIINFADFLHYQRGVQLIAIFLVVKRRKFRDGTSFNEFERRRQHLNSMIRKAAETRGHLMPFRHDRNTIVNLHASLCRDDIHLTSDRGLELYNHSVRKAIQLSVRKLRNQDHQHHHY